MIRIISIVIIVFLISMMLVVGSLQVVVYSQNASNKGSTAKMQPGADNRGSSVLKNLIIDHAGGGFTSLQTDRDNKVWIATGKWDLVSAPYNSAESNSSSTRFNATIHTRGTDNSQGHDHKISDFNLVNRSINSSSKGAIILLNGTATIDTDVGVYHDVPISIRIVDAAPAILSIGTQSNEVKPQWVPQGGTIALLIDERVQDHFGNTPVYGDIRKEK
jgi:hypothetical protein